MTQKDKIRALLSDGRWHSVTELHAICWRYGARLWELRHLDGMKLEKRLDARTGLEEWMMSGGRQGVLML